jgi:HD-GYP domain-containing protein (c-di-GMP phosphodiesterase class II)
VHSEQPTTTTVKRFPLTLYFSGISLLALVSASLLMTYIFTRHNDAILRTSAETQNAALTRALGNVIMPRFSGFLSLASELPSSALREHAQTVELRKAVSSFLTGTTITKVTIYDAGGRIIFSTLSEQIGKDQSINPGFQLAKSGQIASELTEHHTRDAFEGTIDDRDLLSSYVPISNNSGGRAAVFEIYSEVSNLTRQIEDTRRDIIVTVGTPMLLLFVVLLGFVERADRLIASQRHTLEHANDALEATVNARTGDLLQANKHLSDQLVALQRAESTIHSASQRFEKMLDIHQRMSKELELDVLVPIAMREISDYMGADRSSLFLFDWKNMELSAKYAQGLAGDTIRIPLKMGIVGTAILNRRSYNISNAYEHPYFNATLDQTLEFRTECILAVPILDAHGMPLGGIQLLNKNTGRFSPEDEQLAEATAALLAPSFGAMDASKAKTVVDALHASIQCDRITVFRLDEDHGKLVSVYAEGVSNTTISLGMQLGIAGLVAVTGQETLMHDADQDERFDPKFDDLTGYVTKSLICLPIKARKGEVLGVVQVINKKNGRFDTLDLDVMRSLVAVFAVFIENAVLFEDQDLQFLSMMEVMAASIDAKDPLTAGHSQGVADYACRIGNELGFGSHELEVLRVAAMLHDYGKIGINDSVLKKKGELTGDEYSHIQQHARMTHSILDKIYFARKYRAVPLIAASHHEYLDGSGYPQGLTSKQIPFMSKILTVADVYEALTADRHYREGMDQSQALALLNQGRDTRFDSNIIAALERSLARA